MKIYSVVGLLCLLILAGLVVNTVQKAVIDQPVEPPVVTASPTPSYPPVPVVKERLLITVPSVLNQDTAAAESRLKGKNLGIKVMGYTYDEEVAKEAICKMEPHAGGKIYEGGSVEVWLSNGFLPVSVPVLSNENISSAKSLMDKKNLRIRVEAKEYSDSIPSGVIIRTFPESGAEVRALSVVKVWVSEGPRPAEVPALISRARRELPETFTQYEKAMLNYDRVSLANLLTSDYLRSRNDPWNLETIKALSGLDVKLVSYNMYPQLDSLSLDNEGGIICRCKGTFVSHGKDASGKLVLVLQTDYDNNGYWKVEDGHFKLYNVSPNSAPEKHLRLTPDQYKRMGGYELNIDARITADL